MKVITRQTLANDALANWIRQYGDSWNEKADALRSLGTNPKPDDVDAVIGNGSWTHAHCHECGCDSADVVQLGEEPDYESATARICRACLLKALAELDSVLATNAKNPPR